MGDHAQPAAAALLLPKDLRHAGVDLGHVILHVGVPVGLLVLHLRIAHAHVVPEEGHHAGVKVLHKIVLQRAVIVGKIFLTVLHEAGVVHRRGAVDHGVVVIHDKAGVEHGQAPDTVELRMENSQLLKIGICPVLPIRSNSAIIDMQFYSRGDRCEQPPKVRFAQGNAMGQ